MTFREILSKDQIRYMLDQMYKTEVISEQMANGITYIVFEHLDEYLGFSAFEVNHLGRPETKIHKLYVLPSHQKKGIGKQLLDHISKKSVKHANKVLVLNVNIHNSAFHFYEKYGFIKLGEEDIPIGAGYFMNDYILKKSITN